MESETSKASSAPFASKSATQGGSPGVSEKQAVSIVCALEIE